MKPIPGNNEFSPSELYVDRSSDLKLGNKEYIRGLIRCTFYSFIAIMIFFVPLTINGETEILFGYIYKYLIELFGIAGIWMIAILTLGNACASIYGKFFAHENTKVYQYFKDDTLIHLFIYSLGAFYAILFTLHTTFPGFTGPEMIVGGDTGGVMSSIAVQVFWIIPLGAIFIPLILKYGGIDFVGTLMQPIMRPVFKVPGKSAVDAVASFVSSSSVAVIITSNLYKSNEYTRREAATIATSFSAVSIGFAAVVISTAGLMDHFLKVYFSSFLIAFIVSTVMVRLPPLSKKADVFHNGKEQSVEERLKESKFDRKIMKKAVYRAAENGYKADNVFKETGRSLKDGLAVLPKVLCMLTAIGVTCLIIAEYTPIFNWIGLLFLPILQLFVVPNAMEIAPAITVGLAEMFLPVLMIADLIGTIDIKAAYFITALSMVQIIFFSETGAVMLSTKLPVKVKDLVIIFFMRTLIAIPVVALFMHILF